jgi:histidinol-phosphate aminotransferase
VIAEISTIEWHRYPDRAAVELRRGIADLHGVDPSQIFAANGSNEVLQTLLLTFAGPGRRVVTFEPTYQLHGHIARLTGATVVEAERSADFCIDPEMMRDTLASAEPAVTFLCSPNNPTGIIEPENVVAAALSHAPGLVVIDEAYGQFAPRSCIDLVDEDRPLVVTRTFSKTWSMAAVRLGYLIGPSWLVEELEKVVLPYHLDSAKQVAGRVALRFVDQMEQRVDAIVRERERVAAALSELAVDSWPSGANFVLFRPRERRGDAVWNDLLSHDVLVRNCASWPRLSDCLRVTVGTPSENTLFLNALREVL